MHIFDHHPAQCPGFIPCPRVLPYSTLCTSAKSKNSPGIDHSLYAEEAKEYLKSAGLTRSIGRYYRTAYLPSQLAPVGENNGPVNEGLSLAAYGPEINGRANDDAISLGKF